MTNEKVTTPCSGKLRDAAEIGREKEVQLNMHRCKLGLDIVCTDLTAMQSQSQHTCPAKGRGVKILGFAGPTVCLNASVLPRWLKAVAENM